MKEGSRTRCLMLLYHLALGCTVESPAPIKPPERAPSTGAPTQEAEVVPVVLSGFGACRANTCTFHFAQKSTGDVSSFSIDRCLRQERDCPSLRGQLSGLALAKVRTLANAMEGESFEKSYGCPGCADGPIAVLVFHRANGQVTEHMFDPTLPEGLPPNLREVGTFGESLVNALLRCEETEFVKPPPDCKSTLQKIEGPVSFP